ncbi:MAG TPA: alpha/beta hydrolase [Chloroflexota bacterium]
MLIQANGVRLFAIDAGQGGPELVFIHGNGADHTAWHKQIVYFSRITRVIAVDMRGFGSSGKDPEARYTQDKFVADTAAILQAANVRRAILVGWSMGGNVASRVAVEHPELVAGVALVDHNVEAAKTELGLQFDPRYTSEAIVRGLDEDFEGRGFRTMVDSWFPESGPEIDFLKQWFWEIGIRTGRDVVYGIRSIGVREDRRKWLEALTVPVCILQGGDSYIGGRRIADYLASIIPHARKHVFDGHGHALFLTAADEFNAALHEFWKEVAGQ